MIEATKKSDGLNQLVSHARSEGFIKIGVFLGAVVYGVGYIVVTLHLSEYGVSTFELLRVQYVMAGFWFFFPITLSILVAAVVYWIRTHIPKQESELGWAHYTITTMALVITTTATAFPLKTLALQLGVMATLGYLYPSLLIIILALMFLAVLRKFRSRPETGPSVLRRTVLWVLLFGLGMTFLSKYAKEDYPLIPRSLGGGRPVRVKVVQKAQVDLSSYLFSGEEPNVQEVSCRLLFETSSQLILLPFDSNNTAVGIDKSQIGAVIYNP